MTGPDPRRSPQTGPPPPRDHDTDLVVVGGGPAGCAAALMAASVGMRSVLVETDGLCGKLRRIPSVRNVLGGFTGGPELADRIAGDIAATGLCRLEPGRRAAEVRAFEGHAAVTLDDGRRLTAAHVVVATGVGPLGAGDSSWLTVADGAALPTLWGAATDQPAGSRLLVLGADRPLGTFLRAHPARDLTVLVACPPQDDYKVDEVRDDPRVTVLPVAGAVVQPFGGRPVAAELTDRSGRRTRTEADAAFLNLGSAPAAPAGDLARDPAGYCPPERQHPRVLVAGDLRSSRYQRIMVATGSGGQAALRAYYASRHLDPGSPGGPW